MATFIEIELIKNLGKVKFNLNSVACVTLKRREQDNKKQVTVTFVDGTNTTLVEDIHLLDAENTYNKFPK